MKKTILVLLFGKLIFCTFAFGLKRAPTDSPNVILILIDDLSHYGVSAYGAEKLNSLQDYFESVEVATPSMDRLATEGVLFEHAFARPVCEPTRVALMSGMNNRRNFVRAKALHASQITFGDLFNKAGYQTGIFGKWKQSRGTQAIRGKNYVEEFGWKDVFCYDLTQEGPRHIDPNFVINGKPIWYRGINPETGRRYFGPRQVNKAAIEFIEKNKDEPFFLYYSMLLVHDEHTPTPDTVPTSFYDDFEVMTDSTPRGNSPYGAFPGDDRRFFPDMMAYTDKMIGRLLDKVEALGLREETLIMVVGDNGSKNCFSYSFADGSEFAGGKGKLKIPGMQVPLIVSWPGQVPSDTRYAGLTDITDILPTICESASVAIPSYYKMDGVSFWKQVSGQNDFDHREWAYVWYNFNRGWVNLEKALAYATDGRYKLYAPDSNFPEGRMFDLLTDPQEEAGGKKIKYSWNDSLYAGIDFKEFTQEERQAYQKLNAVVKNHAYRPVESLEITSRVRAAGKGDTLQLEYALNPANATVLNVIWESSNPAIASVDKFGTVTCHQAGEVTINIYSWDDAVPRSNPNVPEYSRTGISDSTRIVIAR